MPIIAPLRRANHGSHFHAYGLRGVATLIDPFLGVDHAWRRVGRRFRRIPMPARRRRSCSAHTESMVSASAR